MIWIAIIVIVLWVWISERRINKAYKAIYEMAKVASEEVNALQTQINELNTKIHSSRPIPKI